MRRIAKIASLLGLVASLVGLVVAFALYPKVNWLFASPLVGAGVIFLNNRFTKGPTPQEVAGRAERLLNGTFGGWDVDDYEHVGAKTPMLKQLHLKTMQIGGLPEEWSRLDDPRKEELRCVIAEIRNLNSDGTQ